MVSTPFGRTPRISAAAYTGRAVAPAQPDPVTTGLINKNSLQLAVVSNQIQGMTAQMNSLAGSLQVIASTLATAQAIERQKEAQDQELERRLAEQKLREGKESVIEKKIQAAAIAPAQKLAGTAQFTLGRLGDFFTRLLGGWLLVKGVETLKALGEGNTEKLNDIKNNVLKNLALITGIFIGYKGGLRLLTAAFSRMGGRLLAVAAAGLFVKPFTDFMSFVVDAAKSVLDKAGLGGIIPEKEEPELESSAPPTAANIESGQTPSETPAASNNSNNSSSSPPASSNEANLEGKGGPSLTMPTESLLGDSVFGEGSESKFTFNMFGGPTVDLSKPVGSEAKLEPTETAMGKKVDEGGESKELDASKPAKFGETSLQAESTAETNTDPANVPLQGDPSKGLKPGQISPGDKTLLEMGFTVGEVQSFVDAEKYIGKLGKLPVEDMISPVKKDKEVAEKVGPAPEPPVNVVPVPSGQGEAKPEQVPAGMGPINNAPSFATSNSDNIYILGAMSNFNVVMA